MADFLKAYEEMIVNEGGYVLHKNAGESAATYAGIYRKANPHWEGWTHIDRGETPPAQMVRDFYRTSYWDPVAGDAIKPQNVAETIFNFGVNTHPITASKLAQIVIGATPDGKLGPASLKLLNAFDPVLFDALFALAKIKRYTDICNKDRPKTVNLLGWLNRTFAVLESK